MAEAPIRLGGLSTCALDGSGKHGHQPPNTPPNPRGESSRPASTRWRATSPSSQTLYDASPGLATARALKRALDLFGSLFGLVVLSPLFLGVALVILLTSGRPVFYLQERVGEGGRLFRMFKFRSMRRDAECATGPIWATAEDTRCTKVGAWLRRYNLDELPQLINVLTGEMSLVGPRPERPVFVARFVEEYAGYETRHTVPVGMTGWAQVHGWRGRTSLQRRLDFDLDYVRRWTFGLDLLVLAMTVQHVFWGKTSWEKPARPIPPALDYVLPTRPGSV